MFFARTYTIYYFKLRVFTSNQFEGGRGCFNFFTTRTPNTSIIEKKICSSRKVERAVSEEWQRISRFAVDLVRKKCRASSQYDRVDRIARITYIIIITYILVASYQHLLFAWAKRPKRALAAFATRLI